MTIPLDVAFPFNPIEDHRCVPPELWCPYCGARAPLDTPLEEWASKHSPCQQAHRETCRHGDHTRR